MKKGVPRFLQPNNGFALIFLILFACAAYFFTGDHKLLAEVEFGICAAVLIYSVITSITHRKRLQKYIQSVTYNIDSATKDTLINFPMPMIIFSVVDKDVKWANNAFDKLVDGKAQKYGSSISDIVPSFSEKWLTDGKTVCPEIVVLGDRKYQVFGNVARTALDNKNSDDFLAATYWLDVTDYEYYKSEFSDSKPVAAVITFDNYDDILKNLSDTARAAMRSSVEECILQWTDGTGALIRRYDRDRFLVIFEERYLKSFIEGKFSLLERVHEIKSPLGMSATVSIGIGKDGDTLSETFKFAMLATEMALSRGGDQAVIKNRFNFEFHGMRTNETVHHTKVRARVMANSLKSLIENSSAVFVMGHKNSDLDCIGAAAGVCCIARKFGKTAKIIVDDANNAEMLISRMKLYDEYSKAFIDEQEALISADSKSLLVVVDTNRPSMVVSQNLLLSFSTVALIDHHLRAADYIENPVMSFHETAASSASELVSELVEYITSPGDLLICEAEAMLAGIVLDTKKFTVRTGPNTFDAAAFLNRSGADPVSVKKIMQSDLQTTVSRNNIIRSAKLYKKVIAVAASDVPADRVIASQAADELLNVSGVSASFVLVPNNGTILISARSSGDINVQMILESLGGGGNKATAGAQLKDKTMQEAGNALLNAIDGFLESIKADKKEN